MFGTNENGNNWKYLIANFLVVFLVQVIVKLNELLANQKLPSIFECYEILITAALSTITFYGLNKYTHKKSEPT